MLDASLGEPRRATWNFARELKAYEMYPPLDAHVSLILTTFQASFR